MRLKKELADLEKKIKKLTGEKHDLEAAIAAPDFYDGRSPDSIASKTGALSDIIAKLDKLEEQWLDMQSQIEEAQ